MVIIGIDAHKQTHTLVAIDEAGRKLGQKVINAVTSGHLNGLCWATGSFGPDVKWGIEDCRQVSRRLEHDLMNAGQTVVRVPTKLMARTRASARTSGKSDPIDALAVARAVLREPDLPVARHDAASREIKLLIDRRDDLVLQRTATLSRLAWHVHELDPTRLGRPATLISRTHRVTLAAWLADQDGLVAELAADELADVDRLSDVIESLRRRIERWAKIHVPSLLSLPGCGVLSAAKIAGEAADVTRFASDAAFASYAGLAPRPVWSGRTAGTLRAHRSGNRQLNRALHKIALMQGRRLDGPGRAYVERRIAAGDNATTAVRCLKRKIARVVYRRLMADHDAHSANPSAA
jgi:transposase